MVAVGTGRRLGEILSRMWVDFDLERGTMFVANRPEAGFCVKERRHSWVQPLATLVRCLADLRQQFPD